MNMDKTCEGCLIYERHIEDPDIYPECNGRIYKETNCPCKTCLIKAMCDRPCGLITEKEWYYKNIIKQIRKTSDG